jgi:hypothetical protein
MHAELTDSLKKRDYKLRCITFYSDVELLS